MKNKEKYVPRAIVEVTKIYSLTEYAKKTGVAPSNLALKMDSIENKQSKGFKGDFEVIRYQGGRFIYEW